VWFLFEKKRQNIQIGSGRSIIQHALVVPKHVLHICPFQYFYVSILL
jgi:hypothetical protein